MTPGARHAVLALVGLWIALGSYSLWQSSKQSDALHNSQVKACMASLEPGGVRYIVAQQIQDQIRRAKQVDYHKFFPNVPPGRLHALIHDQRGEQFDAIHQLTDVDCHAQFPKP